MKRYIRPLILYFGEGNMTNAQKIKMALIYQNKKASWLASQLGTTAQAFNQRLKTDKFSTNELDKIANILNAVYSSTFEFSDGTKL